MSDNSKENKLDMFFKMIDFIEDDIAEILESQISELSELSEYECLVISFNHLRSYCGQVGIKFSQIEEHYSVLEASKSVESFLGFGIESCAENVSQVTGFIRVLDEMEIGLVAFEQRCKKTKESFDEWNCVLIMYGYLRKYCNETKTNYVELMEDVSKI